MSSHSKIKVLMIGWEFPPYVTGGLGTHCWNLTKAMSKLGTKIYFVTPHPIQRDKYKFLSILGLNISQKFKENGKITNYGRHYKEKVRLYNKLIKSIIEQYKFDIIHCQDRMTINAAIITKNISKKPLILTIHSTEIDKSKKPKRSWLKIEKRGMDFANRVIAVSNYTKNILVKKYKVNPGKIVVIPNAVEGKKSPVKKKSCKIKYVLYLGRLTYQKGIPYFIEAAKKVLEKEKDVKFLIVGKGKPDFEKKLKGKVKKLNLEKKMIFLGYVKNKDYYYKKAYLFVMPSISEPFGITPLESISNGTPVLVSKQSGISEMLKNCIKFDYWDTDGLAKNILMLVNNKKRYNELRRRSIKELNKFEWGNVAKETVKLYRSLLKN